MILVDSNEGEEVTKILDLLMLDYEEKELKFAVCETCDKIYVYGKQPKECCEGSDYEIVKAGDIIGSDYNFAIEIKRGLDLVNSLNENHIYDQLERLTSIFKNNVILCFVGRFEDLFVDEHGSKRIPQLLSLPAVCAQYGASFIQVSNMHTLIRMLKYFEEKCGTEPKLRLKYKRRGGDLPKCVTMLSAIPGIGLELAKNVSEMHPTIKDVICALEVNEFGNPKKVGPKKRETIRQYLCER